MLVDFSFVWVALLATLAFVPVAALDVTAGSTLDKRVLGLRVTAPDGTRPTLGQARPGGVHAPRCDPVRGTGPALVGGLAILVTVDASPTGRTPTTGSPRAEHGGGQHRVAQVAQRRVELAGRPRRGRLPQVAQGTWDPRAAEGLAVSQAGAARSGTTAAARAAGAGGRGGATGRARGAAAG